LRLGQNPRQIACVFEKSCKNALLRKQGKFKANCMEKWTLGDFKEKEAKFHEIFENLRNLRKLEKNNFSSYIPDMRLGLH